MSKTVVAGQLRYEIRLPPVSVQMQNAILCGMALLQVNDGYSVFTIRMA